MQYVHTCDMFAIFLISFVMFYNTKAFFCCAFFLMVG